MQNVRARHLVTWSQTCLQEHHRCCTLKEHGGSTQRAVSAGVKPNAADVRTILSLTHTATCCQVHKESEAVYIQAYEKIINGPLLLICINIKVMLIYKKRELGCK